MKNVTIVAVAVQVSSQRQHVVKSNISPCHVLAGPVSIFRSTCSDIALDLRNLVILSCSWWPMKAVANCPEPRRLVHFLPGHSLLFISWERALKGFASTACCKSPTLIKLKNVKQLTDSNWPHVWSMWQQFLSIFYGRDQVKWLCS